MSEEAQHSSPPLDHVEYERWQRTAQSNMHAARREADADAQVESQLESPLRAALQRLTQLYLPSRYPDALPEGTPLDSYGPEHSRQAIDDAAAVAIAVTDLWTAVVSAG